MTWRRKRLVRGPQPVPGSPEHWAEGGPLRCWRRGARSPPAGGPRGRQEARPRSEHGWVVGWVTRRPLLVGRGAPDAMGTESRP